MAVDAAAADEDDCGDELENAVDDSAAGGLG